MNVKSKDLPQFLKSICLNNNGRPIPKIVSLESETVPPLRKGAPWADLRKRSFTNGVINFIYSNSVNNQRIREGQPLDREGNIEIFYAIERTWGRRLRGTPLVAYRDKLYLEVKIQKVLHNIFLVSNSQIATELVNPWLRRKTESGRQQVDKPVILRDFALESLRSITVNGKNYAIL